MFKQIYDNGAETTENILESYFLEFCDSHGIQPEEISNSQYSASMQYINQTFVKRKYERLSYSVNPDVLGKLLDQYIYLCNIYDKCIRVYDFSLLSGITTTTLYRYHNYNGNERQTKILCIIMQKLFDSSESSIESKILTDNGNKIGYIASLNHRFGWNNSDNSRAVGETIQIADFDRISELQKLGIETSDAQGDSIGILQNEMIPDHKRE